jgi:hypothetical protein
VAWKIVSWSHETRSGEIASDNFATLYFGPTAVLADAKLTIGEEVVATLDGPPENYIVSKIRKVRFRADENGPSDKAFDWINQQRFGDLMVDESSTSDNFTLWAGDCCEHCADAARIVFKSTTLVQGMDEDGDWDDPYFRRATQHECRDAEIPAGHHTYFVVLTEYEPGTHAGFLVVAAGVEVTLRPCVRG